MPTRMLRNRDLILVCHNFQRTHLWNTLTWHTEVTLLGAPRQQLRPSHRGPPPGRILRLQMSFNRRYFDGLQARDFAHPPPDAYKWLLVDDIRQLQLVYVQEIFGKSGSEVSFFFLCVCVCRCVLKPRQIPCVKYRELARKKSAYAPEAADKVQTTSIQSSLTKSVYHSGFSPEPAGAAYTLPARPVTAHLLKLGVGFTFSPFLDTLAWHDTLTWHFLLDTLVRHSCLTLLTWHFLLDNLTWHSCKTLFFDTLVRRSCLTLLLRHSDLTLLLATLVRHSCATLFFDTLVGHSYLTLLWDTDIRRHRSLTHKRRFNGGATDRSHRHLLCRHQYNCGHTDQSHRHLLYKRQYNCGHTDQSHRHLLYKRQYNCGDTDHSHRHLLCKRQYNCGDTDHPHTHTHTHTPLQTPIYLRRHWSLTQTPPLQTPIYLRRHWSLTQTLPLQTPI